MKNFLFLICFFSLSFASAQQDTMLNMSMVGGWDIDTLPNVSGVIYNDVWGYVDCEGNEYALIGTAESIYFLDISNPAQPTELGHFKGGVATIWRDVKTYRDRAYAISDDTQEGLMIFDMSNIQDTIIKTFHSNQYFNSAHNIFIEEQYGRMYIVGSDSTDMLVFDIATDPDNPVLLASEVLPGGEYVHDVYVRDHIAYCSHGYEGYYIWDFTIPDTPKIMATLFTGEYNHSSWLTDDGQYAYYAEEVPLGRPLGIINLSQKEESLIELEKTFKAPLLAPNFTENRPHNPYVRGNYLISSYYHDGIVIFDISDPLNPILTAFYDTTPNDTYPDDYQGVWGAYAYLPSGLILGSDITRGLIVLSADSISLQAVEPVLYPEVKIETESILPLCEGSSATLEVALGAENYRWFQNGDETGDGIASLVVSESGSYSIEASNGHCVAQSAPFEVVVNPLPDISSLSTDSIEFCETSSEILIAPDSMDFYIWMQDGKVISQQGNQLDVIETGSYVLIAYKDGCASTSMPIQVNVHPLPSAELQVSDTLLCVGDQLTIEAIEGEAAYAWSKDTSLLSDDGNTIVVEENGAYSLVITSAMGCSTSSEEIVAFFNVPLIPSVNVLGNELQSSTAISYQWYLNNELISGATEPIYEASESGFYHVETVDANGCSAISEMIDFLYTGLAKELPGAQLSLSPNPTLDVVVMNLGLVKPMAVELRLTDLNGRLINRQELAAALAHEMRIDLSDLPEGLYLLQLNTEEGNLVRKIVKQ